ncbi:unnamed protein product, partial [Sphacelaria rigidula]
RRILLPESCSKLQPPRKDLRWYIRSRFPTHEDSKFVTSFSIYDPNVPPPPLLAPRETRGHPQELGSVRGTGYNRTPRILPTAQYNTIQYRPAGLLGGSVGNLVTF